MNLLSWACANSIMNGTVFVNACHFVLVADCFIWFYLCNYKVTHRWTMQVTPVFNAKSLLSSMWDVIWELDIYEHVESEWFSLQRFVCICTHCNVSVCVGVWLYGCVCEGVDGKQFNRTDVPLLLWKQPFYSVNHDVCLFSIGTSCYGLNKNDTG